MLLFFAAFKTLPTIDFKCFIYKKSYSNFSNFPHSKKKKTLKKSFEFENHLLIRTDMLQTYFEPAVYIAVSKAEPGLGISYAY